MKLAALWGPPGTMDDLQRLLNMLAARSKLPTGAAGAPLAPPPHPPHPLCRDARPTLLLQTAFGQNLGVVGSFNEWSAQEPLRLEWSEGNVWVGEAELPAG